MIGLGSDKNKWVCDANLHQVMDVRETILKRIKDLRKGEVGSRFAFFSKSSFSSDFFLILLSYALKVPICFGHNVKQEEKLSDFRMDVMEVEI